VWLVGNLAFERMTGHPRLRRAAAATAARDSTQASPPLTAKVDAPEVGPLAPAGSGPDANALVTATPRFFQRLTRLSGLQLDELVAVEAEDHYIQVHTLRGRELVYYRFRDALEDLGEVPGLQIHRSAWVARRGIARLEGRGRNLQVVLVTGERFKVSTSNRGLVREAGLTPP
jgi:DNA-binding LytR/AlgR family response regulator